MLRIGGVQVFQLGAFEPQGDVDAKAFLVLLLTTTGDTLPSIVAGLFEVFGVGGELATPELLRLLAALASPGGDVTQATLDELGASLDDTPSVSIGALLENPVLKDKLKDAAAA